MLREIQGMALYLYLSQTNIQHPERLPLKLGQNRVNNSWYCWHWACVGWYLQSFLYPTSNYSGGYVVVKVGLWQYPTLCPPPALYDGVCHVREDITDTWCSIQPPCDGGHMQYLGHFLIGTSLRLLYRGETDTPPPSPPPPPPSVIFRIFAINL